MARLYSLSFVIYLVAILLVGSSNGYQHRHLRRTLLYQSQAQAIERTNSQDSASQQQRINDLQTELESKLTLRDSALQLLDSEGSLKEKRWGGPHHHNRHNDNSDGNASSSSTLEELQQRLDELNQTIEILYNLLSANFRGHVSITPTRISATATSTSTYYYTTSSPQSSSQTLYTTAPSSAATTMMTSSFNNTISSRSSTSVPTASTAARYSFDPMSTSNVAVYYGQTDQTSNVPLSTICADPDVDIIVLAFINKLSTGTAGYPALNMGPRCWSATSAQVSQGATGLIDCVSDGFAARVKTCQDTGKKVLLSIGGAVGYSETTITSEEDAVRIADNIWNLFGAGGMNEQSIMAIRPFGDIIFDGFDIGKHSSLKPPSP
jgi:Glycosyl hydrolases family 18